HQQPGGRYCLGLSCSARPARGAALVTRSCSSGAVHGFKACHGAVVARYDHFVGPRSRWRQGRGVYAAKD
ncbi:MAG: hypothetical protein ACP5VR_08020, partial [Acidimicrobiales bacterium]